MQPKLKTMAGSNEASPRRPQTARDQKPTFRPQISQGTRQIMENKRKGNIVGSLVDDANRRKIDGKKIR